MGQKKDNFCLALYFLFFFVWPSFYLELGQDEMQDYETNQLIYELMCDFGITCETEESR